MTASARPHGNRGNQRGEFDVLIIPIILLSLFLIGTASFAYWAFSGRQDYKNNSDQKVDAAVKTARQDQTISDDKVHAEADKQPLKTYIGPEQYGSVHVNFPKTWSGYVIASGSGNNSLDGYFQPGVVPSTNDIDSAFALRVQVVDQSYATVAKQYSQLTQKGLTAAAFTFPKVPNVVGIRYEGAYNSSKKNITGSMILMPLRDKTLEVSTESPIYEPDFNNNILPNLSFSP